jgi:hypothetical protein
MRRTIKPEANKKAEQSDAPPLFLQRQKDSYRSFRARVADIAS